MAMANMNLIGVSVTKLWPVTKCWLAAVCHKLKPKSSCGNDGISTKLLRETISYIVQPITHIINRSFDTGIVPQEMKIAKVKLFPFINLLTKLSFKKYRPVSLLPAISKILEKHMYKKVLSFLDANNILRTMGSWISTTWGRNS